MAEISVALFNYESGGRTAPGQYNFTNLCRAFVPLEEAPTVIVLNEAKEWHLWGSTYLFAAANALSEQLGRGYEGRMGVGTHGLVSAPALLYDPQVIRLDYWGDKHETVHPNKFNLAEAHIFGRSACKFRVLSKHWNPSDRKLRRSEAKLISHYRKGPPTLLAGDLNCTSNRPGMPTIDWENADEEFRAHKARQLKNGKWIADSRPLDRLIGPFGRATRPATHTKAQLACFG